MATTILNPKTVENNGSVTCRQRVMVDGKSYRITATAKTEKEARKRFTDKYNKLIQGTLVKRNSITVSSWAAEWFDTYMSTELGVNALSNYKSLFKNHIEPCLGKYSVQSVSNRDCQQVINRMTHGKRKRSTSTIIHVNSVMFQLFKEACLQGIIAKNPVEGVKLPSLQKKEKSIFTKEELHMMKESLDEQFADNKGNLSYIVLTRFLMETGARRGEGLGLKWSNVCTVPESNGTYKVRVCPTIIYVDGKSLEKATPKTKKSDRDVFISPDLFKKMNVLGHECKYVFHTKTMNPISPNNYYKWFKKFCVSVLGGNESIKRYSPHTFRHSFVSRCRDKGLTNEVIKKLTGHTTDKMIENYSHVIPESVMVGVSVIQDDLKAL